MALSLPAAPILAQPGATGAGVLAPAVLAQAGGDLRPAGRSRLKFWGFDVYDAALWTAPGFKAQRPAATPLVLELSYLRNFTADDIARVSLEQMRRHGAFDEAQGKRWQAQLAALLPPVRRGDRIAGVHTPGRGATFFHNERLLGDIADAQFSSLFFSIWLGEATSEPELRRALLAGVEGNP